MQEKSPIKQKILQFIEYKGITKYKFYLDTGVTRGILDQNNGISEENLAKILAYFPEISPDWLLTGRGEMLRDGVASVASGQNESGTQQIIQGNNNSHNSVTVDNPQTLTELHKIIEDKDNTIRLQAEAIANLSQMIGK